MTASQRNHLKQNSAFPSWCTVGKWMFTCLKRRTRSLSTPTTFRVLIWPWGGILNFPIPLKIGTIIHRCFSCVVYADSSGVLQLVGLKDVYWSKYLYLFSTIHSNWVMLPKECVCSCLMYATQAELLAVKQSHNLITQQQQEASGRLPSTAWSQTLQEHECKLANVNPYWMPFLKVKRWSEHALALVCDTIWNAFV